METLLMKHEQSLTTLHSKCKSQFGENHEKNNNYINNLYNASFIEYCFYDQDGNVVDISSIELDGNFYGLDNVTVGAIKEN